MTPEQIKVLEELRDDGVLAGCIDVEEQKALTAALEYIEDMREIEAAAFNEVQARFEQYEDSYSEAMDAVIAAMEKGK